MDLERQKELFSEAYLRAVTAVAGCSVSKPEVDDDSVDWVVMARQYGHPRLDVQLKATAQDLLKEDGVHFPLKHKNYEDLRAEDVLYPRVLLVVLLPGEDPADWIPKQGDDEMVLRRCGYWLSLRGHDPVEKKTVDSKPKPTVVVPRRNVLTPETVKGFMNKIGARLPL